MSNLVSKIKAAQEILEKAFNDYGDQAAIAWTGGKDSTVILHLVRSVFNNKVPFQVFFNDSTMEFEQVYKFIDKIEKDWDLDIKKIKHLEHQLKEFHTTSSIDEKKRLSRIMKIDALNVAIKKYKWQALITGIRWDEHGSRSDEKAFSKRKDHMRVHPILQFTEDDIWAYIRKFDVPYVDLYDQGYRSLGEKPFTNPAKKNEGERSGRDYDKEELMKQLRSLGYY